MRGPLNNFLLVLAAALLQTTVIPFMAIKSVQPDLVLMVVVAYAFVGGSLRGSVVGFSGGLLQDLAVGPGLGLSSLAKTVVGYVAGLLEKSILFESMFLPVLAVFIATLLNNIVYGAAALLFEQGPSLTVMAARLLPSALYNCAVAVLVYPLIRRFVIWGEGLQ